MRDGFRYTQTAGFRASFWFSFSSSMRDPALLVVLTFSVLLLVLGPVGTVLGFHEEKALVREMGLSTLFLSGILVAMVTARGLERVPLARVALLRPVSRWSYYSGIFSGAFLCAVLANAAVAFCGFYVLMHREVPTFKPAVLLAAVGTLCASLLWGLWGNFRKGRPLASRSLWAFFVLNLACAVCWPVIKSGGGFKSALSEADILLVQAEILCFLCAWCVFAAVWAGNLFFGRLGGILTGTAVFILGQIKESLSQLPGFLYIPFQVLIPNFQFVWGGDFFYADLLTLPWEYVFWASGYLILWSTAAFVLGMAVFLSRRFEGSRGRGVSA